jgi:hypothetical protein
MLREGNKKIVRVSWKTLYYFHTVNTHGTQNIKTVGMFLTSEKNPSMLPLAGLETVCQAISLTSFGDLNLRN